MPASLLTMGAFTFTDAADPVISPSKPPSVSGTVFPATSSKLQYATRSDPRPLLR